MLIQVFLLATVVVLAVLFVRRQHGVHIKASKRLAFIAFLMLNAYAVVRPEDVTRVANMLGVGRGTDLLLYLLVVAFVFAVLNFYLRLRDAEQRMTDLARAVALRDADLLNRERGLLSGPELAAVPPADPPAAERN